MEGVDRLEIESCTPHTTQSCQVYPFVLSVPHSPVLYRMHHLVAVRNQVRTGLALVGVGSKVDRL